MNADQVGEPVHAVAGRESGDGTLSEPVNATYNYWGVSGGPGNVSDGVGSNVSDNVIFRPFLNGAPGADFQIAPQGKIDAALNATPAILLANPEDGDDFKPPEDRSFTLGTSYNATGNISADDLEIRLIDTADSQILGVNRSDTLGSNGTANVTIPASNMSGSLDTTVRAQLYNASSETDNATNTGAIILREFNLNPQNVNRNNNNNNNGGGGGGGGATDPNDGNEPTDIEETISEADPTSETEIEVDEEAGDDGSVTVDTSEETESVQEVTIEDDNVQSVSVTEFTGNEEVVEAIEESIVESVTEELIEDVEQDVQEDVEQDVEGDVEEGVDDGTDSGETTTATDSGGGSDVSVNVASVADISADSDNGDEQTTATVTLTADTEDIDDPEQASIYHEVDDGFEELPTDIEEQTSEGITFSGETESFSVFAVAEVQTEEEEEATNETDSAEEATNETDSAEDPDDSGESDSFIPGFGAPVAIVAMIALALLAQRKQ